jgi:hypothetical protein
MMGTTEVTYVKSSNTLLDSGFFGQSEHKGAKSEGYKRIILAKLVNQTW